MTKNTLGSAIETQALVEIDGRQDGDGQAIEHEPTPQEPITDSERSEVMVRISELNNLYSKAETQLDSSLGHLRNAQNEYDNRKIDIEKIELELLQLTKKLIAGIATTMKKREG